MKEAVLLNKLLPHHLGKFDGLHTEEQVNPSVNEKTAIHSSKPAEGQLVSHDP